MEGLGKCCQCLSQIAPSITVKILSIEANGHCCVVCLRKMLPVASSALSTCDHADAIWIYAKNVFGGRSERCWLVIA